MFKTLLKKLVGDKAEGDMKEIQPVVDAVHGFEADMKALSDDGLRSRSEGLRQRIQAHVAGLEKEEQALRADASAMGEDQLEQKEAIYEQIDGLTKRIDESLDLVFSLPFSGMGCAVRGASKSGAVSAFFLGLAS